MLWFYIFVLVVPPNLSSDSGTMTPSGLVRSITCGQDVVIDSFGFTIYEISCPQFNGSSILCNNSQINGVRIFKDGVEIDGSPNEIFQAGPVPAPTEDICGTYTFILENGCGRDVAVSRVICPGKCDKHSNDVYYHVQCKLLTISRIHRNFENGFLLQLSDCYIRVISIDWLFY